MIINQPEEIPFGRRFRFEIPKDPSPSCLFVGVQLGFDVSAGVVFQGLVPGVDPVDCVTGSDARTSWVPAVVAGADAVAVECWGAVGHCACPFTYNEDVVGVGGVGFCNVACGFNVLLFFFFFFGWWGDIYI